MAKTQGATGNNPVVRAGQDQASLIFSVKTDQSQLLMTVKKGQGESAAWLSPIGWVSTEKGTLLDCFDLNGETCVLIPEGYADHIEPGQHLSVLCRELGIDAELNWPEKADARSHDTPAQDTVRASGGLLGKLKGKSAEVAPKELSATELAAQRAAEAERAAEQIRKEMERAKQAQEEARKRAEEAARAAEEARKAEEKRVKEMERAALALAEAEAARKAEQARLEEEQRAEELRLAEEARRAEEARQLEMARQRQAILREERTRLGDALVTLSERREAAKLAASQYRRAASAAASELAEGDGEVLARQDALAAISAQLSDMEKHEAEIKERHDKLGALLASARDQAAEKNKSTEKLASHIDKAQSVFDKADRAAKDAIARRDAAETALQKLLAERRAIKDELAALKDDESELREKLSHAKARLDTAQAQCAELRRDSEGAKSKLAAQQDKLARAEAEQTAASQSLEECEKESDAITQRELVLAKAISMIDEGHTIEEVKAFLGEPAPIPKAKTIAPQIAAAAPVTARPKAQSAPKPRLRPRGEKRVAAKARRKARQIFAPKPAFSAAPNETAKAAALPLTSGNAAANDGVNKLLTGVAAVAIAGLLGYVIVSAPAQTQRVQQQTAAAQKTALPESVQVLDTEVVASTPVPGAAGDAMMAEILDRSELPAPAEAFVETDGAPLDITASAPKPALKAEAKPETKKKKEAPEVKVEARKIEVTQPAAPAPVQTASITPVAKPVVEAAPSRSASTAPQPAAPQSESAGADYSGVITRVQDDLFYLGFYRGASDGQMSLQTQSAIVDFKRLYRLPENSQLTGEFLNSLTRARQDAERNAREAAAAPMIEVEPAPVQMASVTPAAITITPTPAPITQTPKAEPVIEVAIAAPEPEIIPDVIIEAERVRGISGAYPERPLKRGFDSAVKVTLSYDVDKNGDPQNISVVEMDYDGIYASYFEEAGIAAIESQKYSPKTVNGKAVLSTEHGRSVTFRVE